jgi:hypothetical protein
LTWENHCKWGRIADRLAGREQVIDTLKAAFAQGSLTKDELDERVARALVPLTCADARSQDRRRSNLLYIPFAAMQVDNRHTMCHCPSGRIFSFRSASAR